MLGRIAGFVRSGLEGMQSISSDQLGHTVYDFHAYQVRPLLIVDAYRQNFWQTLSRDPLKSILARLGTHAAPYLGGKHFDCAQPLYLRNYVAALC